MLNSTKSEWNVEVVRIPAVEVLPDTNNLARVDIYGNPVIFNRNHFKEGDVAIYIPPDSVCPEDNPHLAFLKGERVKGRKFCSGKYYSHGLFLPMEALPMDLKADVGDDVAPFLGITRHTQPDSEIVVKKKGGRLVQLPGFIPFFGLDPWHRFKHVIKEGDMVVLTEKIHGCNAAYVYKDGKLHVASHRVYRGWEGELSLWNSIKSWFGYKTSNRVTGNNDKWWEIADELDLKSKLKAAEGLVFYGEIYGSKVDVPGKLAYDTDLDFKVFAVYDTRQKRFLNYVEFYDWCHHVDLAYAPVLYKGPWHEGLLAHANGKSCLGDTMKEGFVVTPVMERMAPGIGRVAFKVVSQDFKAR